MTAIPVDTTDGQVAEMRANLRRTIRALMGAEQVTQTTLAQLIGCSQPGLSDRLKGETPFRDDELARIAVVFGREVADLYRAFACNHDDTLELAAHNLDPDRTDHRGTLTLVPVP